ncbi:MAG: TIM barrel protein [Candidatus Micrarchaeota archaeon]
MLKFASAGIPISTPSPASTLEGIKHCASLGLKAMEIEFVHGVRMKDELAKEIGKKAKKLNISLSIHAPYYINLCSDEEKKLSNSRRHIIESARAGHFLNASPIVFHPGFYQKRSSKECEKRAIKQMERIYEIMHENNWKNIKLGPELTGKKSAYGNLEEIVSLAQHFGLKKCIPVIDFAHYHARVANLQNEKDFEKILNYCEKELGKEYKKQFHSHFSGINYSEKGERNHIPIKTNSPPFKPLLKLLKKRKYSGTIVCESPLLEKDALILKKEYEKI